MGLRKIQCNLKQPLLLTINKARDFDIYEQIWFAQNTFLEWHIFLLHQKLVPLKHLFLANWILKFFYIT